MADAQVAVVFSHAQGDEVRRIQLQLRAQVKRRHVVDLQQRTSAACDARRLSKQVGIPGGIPAGRPAVGLVSLPADGSNLGNFRGYSLKYVHANR